MGKSACSKIRRELSKNWPLTPTKSKNEIVNKNYADPKNELLAAKQKLFEQENDFKIIIKKLITHM